MADGMMQTKDIAWLAGLLEGEGSFGFCGTPQVSMGTTDKDVAGHCAHLLGGKVYGPFTRPSGKKPQYNVTVRSKAAAGWMMTLYDLMGERRQGQIRKALAHWRAMPGHKRVRAAACHPERVHFAHDMCRQCYHSDYYQRGKANVRQ